MRIRQIKVQDSTKLEVIDKVLGLVNDDSNIKFDFDYLRGLNDKNLIYRNVNTQALNRAINILAGTKEDNEKSVHLNFFNNLKASLSKEGMSGGEKPQGKMYDDSNEQTMVYKDRLGGFGQGMYSTTYGDGTKSTVWFDSEGNEITDPEKINEDASYAKVTNQFVYTYFNPEKTLELTDEEVIKSINAQLKKHPNEEDETTKVDWSLLKKNVKDMNPKFADLFLKSYKQVFIKKINIYVLVSTYYQDFENNRSNEFKEFENIDNSNYKNLLRLKGDKIAYFDEANKTRPLKTPNVDVPTKVEAKAYTIYDGKKFESEVVETDNILELIDHKSIYHPSMFKHPFYKDIVDCIKEVKDELDKYVSDHEKVLIEKKTDEIIDNIRKNYHYLYQDVQGKSKDLESIVTPNLEKSDGRKANKNVEYDMEANKAIVKTTPFKLFANRYVKYLDEDIAELNAKINSRFVKEDKKEESRKKIEALSKIKNNVVDFAKKDIDESLKDLILPDKFKEELKVPIKATYNKSNDTYSWSKDQDVELDDDAYALFVKAIREYTDKQR